MIRLSPSAIDEVKRLRLKYLKQHPQSSPSILRLGIQASGCSGLSYQMEFQPQVQPQDHIYQCGGIEIAVTQPSLPFIDGLVIDYSEDLMGGGFRFHNPQATQTCGCGYSFAVDDCVVATHP